MKGEEELIKRCIECLIPNCRGHKASKQTLLQHYITHCGILYAQTYNQNQRKYMLSAPDERALLQIKLAISTKDFDRIKLESCGFFKSVLESSLLLLLAPHLLKVQEGKTSSDSQFCKRFIGIKLHRRIFPF